MERQKVRGSYAEAGVGVGLTSHNCRDTDVRPEYPIFHLEKCMGGPFLNSSLYEYLNFLKPK